MLVNVPTMRTTPSANAIQVSMQVLNRTGPAASLVTPVGQLRERLVALPSLS
jgi:hypothetical protein